MGAGSERPGRPESFGARRTAGPRARPASDRHTRPSKGAHHAHQAHVPRRPRRPSWPRPAANAQLFGDEYGTDLDTVRFNEGFGSTGYYDALDTDDDTFLNRSEYATGLYADYDRDNDLQITEDEFGLGTERYYGTGYTGGAFADYDRDASGYLDQSEFGEYYGTEYTGYYDDLDTDDDELLSAEEYGSGLYGAADANQDQVITIDEEGWFEGWFDGDDVEAEITEVGEVYTD